MMKLKSWLIISGTGRNCGKTTLACSVVGQFRDLNPVAVKISPHFHELDEEEDILLRTQDFVLIREHRITDKDSSRMLQAGAVESYYIQTADKAVPEVLSELVKRIGSDRPVICESGGLRRVVEPGLFIRMRHAGAGDKAGSDAVPEPDLQGEFQNIPEIIDRLTFNSGAWTIKGA